VLEPLSRRQCVLVDFVQPPQVAGQRMRLAIDRVTTQVFEQVVVRVHPIERCVSGMRFVKITEQIVYEMRKGLRSNHRSMTDHDQRPTIRRLARGGFLTNDAINDPPSLARDWRRPTRTSGRGNANADSISRASVRFDPPMVQ